MASFVVKRQGLQSPPSQFAKLSLTWESTSCSGATREGKQQFLSGLFGIFEDLMQPRLCSSDQLISSPFLPLPKEPTRDAGPRAYSITTPTDQFRINISRKNFCSFLFPWYGNVWGYFFSSSLICPSLKFKQSWSRSLPAAPCKVISKAMP